MSPAPLAGICFDAVGTLFDVDRLLDDIDDRIGPAAGAAFGERLVAWSWLVTAADRYRPFAELAESALHATASEFGVRLDNGTASSLLSGLHRLPLSPGAGTALRELQPAQLAVLSNSTEESIKAMMHNAGVAQCVPYLLSADSVSRFKPAPQVYALASMAFGVSSDRVLLVSAHDWDIAGAHMAGMRTAWVSMGRAESAVAGVRADVVVHTLEMLPDALAQRGLIDFEPSGTTIPGKPMPAGADYTGHDKISADSFPASDPPAY